ncbi:MAG: fatty acid/phospholipid synthesis protein PlsX [Eubacterium sp.]|nr:fatty acid/phospholipid synthesis protein PlsX [Eubacterium sp.]
MDLNKFFKAFADGDNDAVVFCDCAHMIVYMNDAARARYRRDLTGKSILDCHNENTRGILQKILDWFAADAEHNRVHAYFSPRDNADVYIVALRDEEKNLLGYYEKHEVRTLDESPFYQMD